MAIRSGFFNSVNGDRKYDAKRFAEYFATLIGNGVFPNPSTGFQVISNNNDMTVTVKQGTAWINGYICINEDDYILNITPADGVLNRIDRVVLRYDVIDREIRVEVKQGDFATNAVAKGLQRDADAYELGIADIAVNKGIISISQANITDLRLNNDLCGIVHGLVDQVDTTTLFNQYVDWYTTNTTQAEIDIDNIKQQFQTDLAQFNNDWDAWFSQQQSGAFILNNEKGVPYGVATLDETGKIPDTQLPVIEIPVISVNNKTGDVVLTASDIKNNENKTIELKLSELSTQTAELEQNKIAYSIASGMNSYVVTIEGITALTEGLSIKVKFTNSNTGASTLNINNLGAKSILKSNGNALSSGNIKAGQICHLVYTGSVFQLLGEGGEYGTATPTEVLSGYTIGTEEGLKDGTLTLSGNAVAANVLTGKTFYNTNPKSKFTGSMPNQGAMVITPGAVNKAIPVGYHNGSGYVVGDANLKSENIRQGVNIFGVVGTVEAEKFPNVFYAYNRGLELWEIQSLGCGFVEYWKEGIYIHAPEGCNDAIILCTKVPIDLTDFHSLYMIGSGESNSSIYIEVATTKTGVYVARDYISSSDPIARVFVESLSGNHYIRLYLQGVKFATRFGIVNLVAGQCLF